MSIPSVKARIEETRSGPQKWVNSNRAPPLTFQQLIDNLFSSPQTRKAYNRAIHLYKKLADATSTKTFLQTYFS